MSTVEAPASMPSVIPAGVPPGLEYLIPTNQIIVQEIKDGIFFSSHTAKKYDIYDASGRRIFYATETSYDGCCNSSFRNWNIDIFDCMGQSVISGSRTGGGPCETNQLSVTSPQTGLNLGGVAENRDLIGTSWNILDGSGAPVLFLDAPIFSGGIYEKEFPLYTLDEHRQQLGKITKKFTGMFAREDVFGVQLPVNLDVKIKAVMIYATFLIDFQFYEQEQNRSSRRRH